MTTRPKVLTGTRKHILTDRMKALAACSLAQKIGYLQTNRLPDASIFEMLPTQSFNPNRIIRYKADELYLLKNGSVEIWHTYHDYLVKELETGMLFGELGLLGQTMLGTQAISGRMGATVAVMDIHAAREWIKSTPISLFEIIGSRLMFIEVEHYRARFQLADSRIAALLLELAGAGSTVVGFSHAELGKKIGLYRETVTNILDAMKLDKLIELGRKRIIILDKRALRELEEL